MREKIEEIKQKALENKIPIIMDDTLEEIKKILIKKQPKKILEIGTAVGYSAISFYEMCKCRGEHCSSAITIDTIELDEERAKEAIHNIKTLGLEDSIKVLIGDAVEILPTLNSKYDIIFIDASKGKYPIFLENGIRMSNKGSVIIADNVLYKGYVLSDYNKHKQRTAVRSLREYLKLTEENPLLETEILEVGDGLAVSEVK